MNFKLVSSGKRPYIIDVKGAKHEALGDCPDVHQTVNQCVFSCRYLSYTLNSTLIRKQDASLVITAVASTRLGHELAWDFVREHWDHMFTE